MNDTDDIQPMQSLALGRYPTPAFIQSRILHAKRFRDATLLATMKFALAGIAAAARPLADFIAGWVARRLARNPHDHDDARTAWRLD